MSNIYASNNCKDLQFYGEVFSDNYYKNKIYVCTLESNYVKLTKASFHWVFIHYDGVFYIISRVTHYS